MTSDERFTGSASNVHTCTVVGCDFGRVLCFYGGYT